ncbi:MAG: hypothetical protein OXP09_16120 [Gammaproteobacteria bacterium]|nr:hypothetical protein [Gammaproteobacteria bacterium]
MLKRHDVLDGEVKMDRDWWYATKLVAVIVTALAAAYVVHATLL